MQAIVILILVMSCCPTASRIPLQFHHRLACLRRMNLALIVVENTVRITYTHFRWFMLRPASQTALILTLDL